MMEQSEETALARLDLCEALIERQVASFEGRIFNKAGDATLAEFTSPINALRCAVEIGVALAVMEPEADAPLRSRRVPA
jgi:adenylate cyclase